MTEAEWLVRNARRPETGSDFVNASANKRTWKDWQVTQNEGIFGRSDGRKARARVLQDIRDGQYNEGGRDVRANAAPIQQYIRGGEFILARGLGADEAPQVPARFR